MRLLVTRAAEDAARTKERLEALGHQVIVSPLLAIVSTQAQWPEGVVDAVVATSANAFSAELRGLSDEARRLMPLFIVGARTADMARRRGFLGRAAVAESAAMLVFGLTKLSIRPKRVVYLAGRDRKPDIEAALASIGQGPELLEVYEAVAAEALAPAAIRAIQAQKLDGVLHFSRRSAEVFLKAATAETLAFRTIRHFCMSEDVAAPLREAECESVRVATAPNETALFALLGSTKSTQFDAPDR